MDKSNGEFCFTHPDGENIYLFILRNSIGTEVCITNYGATITSFKLIQSNGQTNDIVLGFDEVQRYMDNAYLEANPYMGAAIGRYGNRIKNGEFNIDGKSHALDQNLGTEHLHGGYKGFDKVVWSLITVTANTLALSYESKDGEEGYPGNLTVKVQFELNDQNELVHEYVAITDKPTPVNLTHHSYFNLNNGEGTIENHFVKINASNVLAQDENLTATGTVLPVADTRFDFRQSKQIGRDWIGTTGYDQSFLIDMPVKIPAAEAYSAKSGVKLEIFTTEPVVHLYTGQSIPKLPGKNGKLYGPFSGFCLETQVHPNAINIAGFPDTILRPGKTYRHRTVYKLSVS
jgi:aldose 1-epimerase